MTSIGLERLEEIGVRIAFPGASGLVGRSVPLCRPCLDWSERRVHLAGRLGAALCRHSLEQGSVRKRAGSRALDVTPEGRRAYHELFRVELDEA